MKRKSVLLLSLIAIVILCVLGTYLVLTSKKDFDSEVLNQNIKKAQQIHEYFRGAGMGLVLASYSDESSEKKSIDAINKSVGFINSYFKYIDTEYKFNDFTIKNKDSVFLKYLESISSLKAQDNELKTLNDKMLKKSKNQKYLLDNISLLSNKINLYMSTCKQIYNTGLYTLIKEDRTYSFDSKVSSDQFATLDLIPYTKLPSGQKNNKKQEQLSILESKIN